MEKIALYDITSILIRSLRVPSPFLSYFDPILRDDEENRMKIKRGLKEKEKYIKKKKKESIILHDRKEKSERRKSATNKNNNKEFLLGTK